MRLTLAQRLLRVAARLCLEDCDSPGDVKKFEVGISAQVLTETSTDLLPAELCKPVVWPVVRLSVRRLRGLAARGLAWPGLRLR